jgi:ABC-type multidrug transport system ATPase subunit
MVGRTTLVVAHRLSTISLAERVVLLDGGRIVADGTHEQLLETTPLYAEVLAQAEEAEAAAARAAAAGDRRGTDGSSPVGAPTGMGGVLAASGGSGDGQAGGGALPGSVFGGIG